jgi:hypothetical protein
MLTGGLAPITPALILFLGVLLQIFPGWLMPRRWQGALAVLVAAGGIVVVPFLDRVPEGRPFWPWGPPMLFGDPLAFGLDALAAPFVVGIGLLNLTGALVSWHEAEGGQLYAAPLLQPGRASPKFSSLMLLSFAGLLFLLAANWPTLVVSAALYDVTLTLLFVQECRQPSGGAVRRFLLPVFAANLALMAAAVLAWRGGTEGALWETPMPAEAGSLLVVAALLRMGCYPLHGWALSWRSSARSAAGAVLPPLITRGLGLYLWTMAVAQGAISGPWIGPLLVIATVGLLASAMLAWGAEDYREGMAHLASYLVSEAVLVVPLLRGGSPEVILPLAVNLLFGLSVLSLGPLALGVLWRALLDRRGGAGSGAGEARFAPPGPALLSLLPATLVVASFLGVPLTPGFTVRLSLYRAALSYGDVLPLFALLFGEALSFAALLRWVRSEEAPPGLSPFLLQVVALALLALPFLIVGISPAALEWLMGSASGTALPGLTELMQTLDLPLVGGLLLPLGLAYWLERRRVFIRSISSELHRLLGAMLRLEWAERTLAELLSQLGRALRLFWGVIEGEHYLGWGVILALGAVVFWLYR